MRARDPGASLLWTTPFDYYCCCGYSSSRSIVRPFLHHAGKFFCLSLASSPCLVFTPWRCSNEPSQCRSGEVGSTREAFVFVLCLNFQNQQFFHNISSFVGCPQSTQDLEIGQWYALRSLKSPFVLYPCTVLAFASMHIGQAIDLQFSYTGIGVPPGWLLI